MLYEFKSRATGTVVMTQSVGDLVMKALGREPSPTGVITVAQIPGAVAALRAAANVPPPADEFAGAEAADDDADDGDEIAFSARVLPLIEMLEAAHKAGKDVTWGV